MDLPQQNTDRNPLLILIIILALPRASDVPYQMPNPFSR